VESEHQISELDLGDHHRGSWALRTHDQLHGAWVCVWPVAEAPRPPPEPPNVDSAGAGEIDERESGAVKLAEDLLPVGAGPALRRLTLRAMGTHPKGVPQVTGLG